MGRGNLRNKDKKRKSKTKFSTNNYKNYAYFEKKREAEY